jgi:cysteine desulfurase
MLRTSIFSTSNQLLRIHTRLLSAGSSAQLKEPTNANDKFQELGKLTHKPLYLDAQATTQLDPRVLDKMLPYLTNLYGNPHSRTHAYGWESEKAVEAAREEVASLINADPKEIIFTSGATESNNIAIKGVAKFYKDKKNHIITTQIVSVRDPISCVASQKR